eukprot:comp22529_c0_seq3/m.34200 comp22529_c0_seq3/g.34200  ORF comp22529_c0_seq3/g.34200 comp22529_c0_seq3/m.34200 type:complete len:169 (-) comp22529_c0_seq3:20-526(-)
MELSWLYIAVPVLVGFILFLVRSSPPPTQHETEEEKPEPPREPDTPERVFTVEELKQYDGSTDLPVYVAVKGWVFDVSPRREMYAPGQGYAIFAGKDASRGLGMSSLTPADALSDFSTLSADHLKVLNDWEVYYRKRYACVGHVEGSHAASELAKGVGVKGEEEKKNE